MLIAAVLFLSCPSWSQSDLDMTHSVERFVMESAPAQRVPEPYRHLIEDLGSDCYQYRESSSRRLKFRIGANQRWLVWGRRHPDLEIRHRCNILLFAINRCRLCGGAGKCIDFQPHDVVRGGYTQTICRRCGLDSWDHNPHSMFPCRQCKGFGSAWTRGMFE